MPQPALPTGGAPVLSSVASPLEASASSVVPGDPLVSSALVVAVVVGSLVVGMVVAALVDDIVLVAPPSLVPESPSLASGSPAHAPSNANPGIHSARSFIASS
jgi:hypothetical protein